MSDDFAKGFVEVLNEASKSIKEDRKIPKTMDYVLRELINDISQYCGEVLDNYFIIKHPYKRTIKDWDYRLLDSQELKDKILKESWAYTQEWEYVDCWGNEERCGVKECTKEEHKKCFEIHKRENIEDYKRAIDIGINYFKKYIKGLKENDLLRKEYLIKPTKQNDINDYSKEIDNNILDLLSKSIDNAPIRLEVMKEKSEFKEMSEKKEINWNDEKYHYCEKCGHRFELVHFKDKEKVRTLCEDCFTELIEKELGISNWTIKEVEKIYPIVVSSIEENKQFYNSHLRIY